MDSQSITIPGELPNLNAVLAGAKRHWSTYASINKQQTNKVAWIAKGQLSPIDGPVDLVFHWVNKSHRVDPDNVSPGSKYIIDGLVALRSSPTMGARRCTP